MAPIPDGFAEVPDGLMWGTGPEPFPADVPVGTHYLDKFGNRAVIQADGTVLVEGIGVGVNAGKPDGEWWPYSPLLAAGPTDSDPWIGDQTTGSAPQQEGADHAAPPAPVPPAPAPEPAPAPPDPEPEPTPTAHLSLIAEAWEAVKRDLKIVDHAVVKELDRLIVAAKAHL